MMQFVFLSGGACSGWHIVEQTSGGLRPPPFVSFVPEKYIGLQCGRGGHAAGAGDGLLVDIFRRARLFDDVRIIFLGCFLTA